MKIFSIDLETTGLNPKQDQVLQIGVVYFDTCESFSVRELHTASIKWDRLMGHPKAFHMNRNLIQAMSEYPGTCLYLPQAMEELCAYIRSKFDSDIERVKFVAAGKNFAGFDNLFLPWPDNCRPHQRVLDPTSMYMRPRDEVPPSLQVCCERAGIVYNPEAAHNAVYDADLVAECVYKFIERQL